MTDDVLRFQDLKNKVDKAKTEITRVQVEETNIEKEMELVKKELIEKFKVPADKIEEYKIKAVEERLRNHFGTKVSLHHGKNGGSLVIYYYSDDDLDAVLKQILKE